MGVKPRIQSLLAVLGKTGSLRILETLQVAPKRFNELKPIVASDRTLALRIRELQQENLIEAVAMKDPRKARNVLCYQITQRGLTLLEKVSQIK